MKNHCHCPSTFTLHVWLRWQAKACNNKQAETDTQTVEAVPVASQKLATIFTLPAQLVPFETVDIFPQSDWLHGHDPRGSRFSRSTKANSLSGFPLRNFWPSARRRNLLYARRISIDDCQGQTRLRQGHLHAFGYRRPRHQGWSRRTTSWWPARPLLLLTGSAVSENNVAAARDALRSVTQLESYLNIYAPFDGIVTTRNLHPGALVGPASGQSGTMPLVQIVDGGHLRLVVPVPEPMSEICNQASRWRLPFPPIAIDTFHAPIARISHNVDLNTRTMPVELRP